MLRNKNGVPFSNKQLVLFIDDLRNLYKEDIRKNSVEEELVIEKDFIAVENFIYLISNKNNFVYDHLEKAQRKYYKEKDLNKAEDIISGLFLKFYIEKIVGIRKSYPPEMNHLILDLTLKYIRGNETFLAEDFYKFKNKFLSFLKSYKAKIKLKIYNFKNSQGVRKLLYKYSGDEREEIMPYFTLFALNEKV